MKLKKKYLCWTFGIAAAIGVGYLALRLKEQPASPHDMTAKTTKTTFSTATYNQPRALSVASFNIQFLGSSRLRDHEALADIVKTHDAVVVQELVAPPYDGFFPNGEPFKPDPESAAFFDAMAARGFAYMLSEEDTGTGDRIHLNSSATEWYVTFYKPDILEPAYDLPHGFLADDRSNHPDYERVPYAFPFRTQDRRTDFVLISVHLQPGAARSARRHHEIQAIALWIDRNDDHEKDFIILGDMNIESVRELAKIIPEGFRAVNDNGTPTNTNVNGPRPYDNILYRESYTDEDIDRRAGFTVINLVAALRPAWERARPGMPYPGDPYDHNLFRQYYSDHNPVVFRIRVGFDRD